MIYVILVLSIIFLILMLIFFLYKNNSNKSNPTPNPTSEWTSEEKSSFFKFLKLKMGNIIITVDTNDCIISNLSKNNISYKNITDKTDEEIKEILKKYGTNCILGVKGKWSDNMKIMMMEYLMGNLGHLDVGVDGECALCILGFLEQTYNPEEVNEKNILQKIDPLKTQCLNICKK